MGVFNWDPSPDKPVLTLYFWIYIGLAMGLTAVTVGLWWFLTRARRRMGKAKLEYEDGESISVLS